MGHTAEAEEEAEEVMTDRIVCLCRGCRKRHGEARRALGPWALLDVGSPTGICLECAAALQWSVPLLAGIGTPGQDQAVALHTEAVMRAQGDHQ